MDDYPFNVPHAVDTPVDWYITRMKLSGISEGVARKCGFMFRVDPDVCFRIPYFTVDGCQTTLTRQRNRDSQHEYGPTQSGGGWKGKYTQPKNSKNQVYWPPLTDQTNELFNPGCPLIVCEGELKAVACKMHILAQGEGHEALVCGVPGTNLNDDVINMLKQIRCKGPGDERRIVYLAMDWNAKGQSRERAEQLQFDLKRVFQAQGAQVFELRWPIEKGAGEQKLDDWLVGGGDLSAAMRDSVGRKTQLQTDLERIWDYLNSHYCIMHGKYIPLSNFTQKYTITDFVTMENEANVQISEKRTLNAHQVWALQPKEKRNEVDGYIFVPAPLGQDPERYVHEDGRRLLNTAPPTQWHCPPWGADVPDCTPFLNLIQRLCQGGSKWFIDYLAHTAQRPTERGSHIIVFKDIGGTGKSRLFETLDLVFGRYSGPIGDALTSNFNAMLEHLIIAWWSDPVIHGGANRDLESALKNFSGDSKITINHKGGAKYTVTGYGRLVIATNKEWIVPFDSKERRYVVFGGLEALDHTEAGEYMAWLKNGGVEAIRLLLTQRDLSEFDIHEQGPRTEQRVEMEKASAHPLLKMLEGEYFEDRDIWSTDQIRDRYKDNIGRPLSAEAIGLEMKRAGMSVRVVKVDGKATRLRAIRNVPLWDARESADWATEFKKGKF